jgi:hypothetical protein
VAVDASSSLGSSADDACELLAHLQWAPARLDFGDCCACACCMAGPLVPTPPDIAASRSGAHCSLAINASLVWLSAIVQARLLHLSSQHPPQGGCLTIVIAR